MPSSWAAGCSLAQLGGLLSPRKGTLNDPMFAVTSCGQGIRLPALKDLFRKDIRACKAAAVPWEVLGEGGPACSAFESTKCQCLSFPFFLHAPHLSPLSPYVFPFLCPSVSLQGLIVSFCVHPCQQLFEKQEGVHYILAVVPPPRLPPPCQSVTCPSKSPLILPIFC